MTTAAKKSTAKPCYCNHCNEPHHRRELDAHFLCPKCRALPGVRGYRDPNKRGLEKQGAAGLTTAEWLDETSVLVEEDGVFRYKNKPEPAKDDREREITSPGRTISQWRRAVLADPALPAELKVLLVRLSLSGDWKTGANIWPSHDTLAEMIGRTAKQVRTWLADAQRRGWIAITPRTPKGRGQTSNLYVLRWPEPLALGEHDLGGAPAQPLHG